MLDPKHIDAGIEAGLELFNPHAKGVRLPYSDGLFMLKQLLVLINTGQIGLVPMQANAEGRMAPAPSEDPNAQAAAAVQQAFGEAIEKVQEGGLPE